MEHDTLPTPEPLCCQPAYPQRLGFVLKLHRDCLDNPTRLKGRIEHPASGRQAAFQDFAQLQQWLLAQLSDGPLL